MDISEEKNSNTLVNVIGTAIQIPGVKVNRESFLLEQFKKSSPELRNVIIEHGPVNAKYPKKELRKMACKLINERTLMSSGASFIAGLPGGISIAATIPADLLQF